MYLYQSYQDFESTGELKKMTDLLLNTFQTAESKWENGWSLVRLAPNLIKLNPAYVSLASWNTYIDRYILNKCMAQATAFFHTKNETKKSVRKYVDTGASVTEATIMIIHDQNERNNEQNS